MAQFHGIESFNFNIPYSATTSYFIEILSSVTLSDNTVYSKYTNQYTYFPPNPRISHLKSTSDQLHDKKSREDGAPLSSL